MTAMAALQLVALMVAQSHVKTVSLIGLHMDLSAVIQPGMSMELIVLH